MRYAFTPKLNVIVTNVSGMDIPPRSVVVVTSVTTIAATSTQELQFVTNVDQYGCGKTGMILVTGGSTIKAGSQGPAYYDQVIYVAFDSGSPGSGEEWGPSDGSWVLTRTNDTKGFIAHGYASQGETPRMSMFARTFIRQPASTCSSSSSSASSLSDSSNSSGSITGSSSSSGNCGCVTVVTSVSCSSAGLTVTYGQVKGCC
jgi:hypothetical protein